MPGPYSLGKTVAFGRERELLPLGDNDPKDKQNPTEHYGHIVLSVFPFAHLPHQCAELHKGYYLL
jgi:hypothetical protein